MTRLAYRREGDAPRERATDPAEHGEYNLAGIKKSTISRSRRNLQGLKEAHARIHAACMAAPAPAEKKSAPPHLLAAFK